MANHPNRSRNRKVADQPSMVLMEACATLGVPCNLMWEIPGPKHSQVAFISCYAINGAIVIVETFRDSRGWDAFTSSRSPSIDETITDVFARVGLKSLANVRKIPREEAIRRCSHPDCGRYTDRAGTSCRAGAEACAVMLFPDAYLGNGRPGGERRADPAGAGKRQGRYIRSGFDRRKAKA